MELIIESKKYGPITILYSAEDHALISMHKWYVEKHSHGFYAGTKVGGKSRRMHRMVLGEHIRIVDHINRRTTDNRRENLREVNASQNSINRSLKQCVKFRGVFFDKPKNTYRARVKINGVFVYQRRFKTEKEAAIAYNEAAKKYHGEFAMLNIVP